MHKIRFRNDCLKTGNEMQTNLSCQNPAADRICKLKITDFAGAGI